MISGPLTAQKTDHYTGAFDWRVCRAWPVPAGLSGPNHDGSLRGDVEMHKFSSKASVSVLCAALGLAAAGCGQINNLKATMAFKDANQLYRGQDFRAAVAKYSETIDLCRGSDSDCTDSKLNRRTSSSETVSTISTVQRAAGSPPMTPCSQRQSKTTRRLRKWSLTR